mmetsp:Transcript_48357/g.128274  ORF Transcript_48357/g.128274 Transcript_48357/m.128274 type:complete len:278 (-) Transcript_48357:13-846(-)
MTIAACTTENPSPMSTLRLSTANASSSAPFLESSSTTMARRADRPSVCTAADWGNSPSTSTSSCMPCTAAASPGTPTHSPAAAFLLPSLAVHSALRALQAAAVVASSPPRAAAPSRPSRPCRKPSSRSAPRLRTLVRHTSGTMRQNATMASPRQLWGGAASAWQICVVPSKSVSRSLSVGVRRIRRPMSRSTFARASTSAAASSTASMRSMSSGGSPSELSPASSAAAAHSSGTSSSAPRSPRAPSAILPARAPPPPQESRDGVGRQYPGGPRRRRA